jgi:hypothetical protein
MLHLQFKYESTIDFYYFLLLFLDMSDESASGANLTTCNHAIFVHALFSDSLQKYVASETQAIGRIRRYGQNKKCCIPSLILIIFASFPCLFM